MNKHVASLAKGFLSVFLILSLVLPSVAVPHIAWASLGGGETGAGGFDSSKGEGPNGKSSAEAAAEAAEAAGQEANDAAAAGLSANAPEGVSVKGSDATPNSDPNNPTVDVDFGNGQTVSGVSPQAAQAMMDAFAAGLAPATNGQTPGFNPSATAEAHATGKAGIDGVVGNVSATLGSAASVAAAESKAAIGLAAAQSAAAAAAKSMNPFGAAPAVNSLSFTTLSADEALSAASKHPAMFSPQSLSTSLPAGFTFSPPTPTSRTFSSTPIGGKTTAQTFSLDNATIDATSFSLGKQLGVPSMPGFDAPIGETHSPTKSDDTSKNQYAQYALGMEIGRMATQKSLAESKYKSLEDNLSFNPATQQTQMAMLDATKAEIDAWAATIDARVDPTTQNQAVATLSQSKATAIGQIADQIANTTDNSKATQLSKSLAEAIASYDSKISAAKSSVEAAQHALSTAENNARASLYGPPAGPPATQFATALDTKFVDDLLGVPLDQRTLTPVAITMIDLLSVVPVVGPVQQAVLSVTPTPMVQALADAVPFSKSVQAVVDQSWSKAIGFAALDALGFGFGKAVSVGLGVGAVAGKSAVSGPSSIGGKAAANAASTASVAGKTATKSAGQTIDVSFDPATKSVTFSAPTAPAAVAEGRIAGTAAKSADNVATPSSLAGKAADDVASPSSAPGKAPTAASDNTTSPAASTPASTAAKSADDVATPSSLAGKAADDVAAPSSPTSGKAQTAANDNVPANTPANANALGSRSATTPTSAATKADDVAAPVSTPASASTPTAAPAVPGVTVADALVGPQAAPTSLAGKVSLSASHLADVLGIPSSVAPSTVSAGSRSTAAVMALAQALSAPVSPASLAKSVIGIADDVSSKVISRTANDLAVPSQNSITSSLKSLDNVTPTAPAKSAAPAAGKTTSAPAPTTASTPAVAPVTAPIGTQTSVAPAANQTAPATTQTSPTQTATTPASNQTAPTAAQNSPTQAAQTAPATFAQTPDVTNAVPTSRPDVTTSAAQPTNTQTAPAANQTAPAAAPTAQAPASTLGPVGDALSTIGKGLTDAFNELFGVKPAASQPAKTVNFANLEKTPATQDFVGAVADDARFLSFEDNTTAARALLRDLENKIKGLEASKTPATLNNIIPKYSPASDNNNPAQHANNIAAVAAKDVPGFTADTPITLADLKGPVGIGLVKGFAKAEEGISLPTAEAAKGVAAYTALPSIPTTLVDGVYAPTSPADQVTLNNIRNGSPTIEAPAAPKPAQILLAVADKLSKSTPASLALEVQAAGLSRIADALPQTKAPAAEPAVATPSAPTTANPSAQTQAPAQVSPTPAPTRVVMQNQNARRDLDITPKLKDQIAYAAEKAGVVFVGTSGGQPSKADVARGLAALTDRKGSNRHDHGNAVDGYLKDADTGRVLDFTNPNDLPRFELFIAEAVKAGITGVGAGVAYMGPNTIHIGGGSALAWGAGGKVANAPGWLTAAHKKGLADAKGFDLAAYKASQAQTPQATPAITMAIPTPRPDTVPTQVTIPVTVIPQTNPIPPASSPQSGTQATVSAPTAPTVDPVAEATNEDGLNTPGYPSSSGQNNDSVSPTSNTGTPPDYQSAGGTGPGRGTSLTNAVLSPIYAFFAAIAVGINALLGADDDDGADTTEPIITPATVNPDSGVPGGDGGSTGESDGGSAGDGTAAGREQTLSRSDSGTNKDLDSNSYPSTIQNTSSTSTKITTNVLIQVDGNTGNLYFSINGVFNANGDLLADSDSYAEQEPDNEATGDSPYDQPRIVLDDQRLNILYSDGTYAPVVIDGVWYESADDPNYVYTVEYYLDGELVAAADNAGVLPEGNPLTNLLGNLFSSSDEYGLEDVDTITRALVDPDEQVPADEYYVYRVYLNGGGTRSTTVPRYTSYRFMSERFAETGFTGNVTALIAESVEVPPPSRGGVSAIVDTFKKIGLSVVDIFRDDEAENPVVTDFGNLTPSDDGEITMADIRNVTVLLDVEAECPLAPGLDRPYLYEIVIAQAAISGATTDQAFRAVRCGGGDKADFVEQIAAHFETFDGVGTIDRQAMSDMVRFALFKDLDLSFLLENDEPGEPTATSTPATVPDGEDQEYVPNLTNDVVFEVKAVGSQGQTLLDWSVANEIRIGSTVQLYFRWDGSDYEQCLPFLNDNGIYALKASGSAMTTGNTESEGYDVPEANTTYRIECGGQRNNEFGVDDRSIKVIIE